MCVKYVVTLLIVVGEEVLAVGESDPAKTHGRRAVPGQITDDGDAIAGFERFFRPSVFDHLTRRGPFTDPPFHSAGAPLHVENDLGMRIGPLELDDRALQLALVVAIIRGV